MDINKILKELAIQEYITLGYLYLVIIGIINIVIYYSSFDINIFDYIAITDILLAPVNMLFLSYQYTVMILIVIGIITYLLKFAFLGINKLIENSANKFNQRIVYKPIIIFIILFSYIFVSLTNDMTNGVHSRVKSKTYKHNTTLTFTDNTEKDVYIFATTSLYLFYLVKGEEIVTIMPIGGNVKSIKDIRK